MSKLTGFYSLPIISLIASAIIAGFGQLTQANQNHSRPNASSLNSSSATSPLVQNTEENRQQSQTTKVELNYDSTSLVIDIQELSGAEIGKFDYFRERLMHLVIVSDDLQFYQLVHPEYQGNGRFKVEVKFPKADNYTLFSNYKPSNHQEQIVASQLTINDDPKDPTPEPLDSQTKKVSDNTDVQFSWSDPAEKKQLDNPRLGRKVDLVFNLKDNSNNQPVGDLETYLGRKGYLVIIRQPTDSSSPSEKDYISIRALKDTSNGEIRFQTQFMQEGEHQLWCHFKRGGQIVARHFPVNVVD